MILSKALPK